MKCSTIDQVKLDPVSERVNVYSGAENGAVVLCVAPLKGMGKYTTLTPLTALSIAASLACAAVKAALQ